jgi:phytanoyl-CoA hydroxylase
MSLDLNQIQQFRRDGYLLLRGMVPASQCDRMRAVTQDHLQRAVSPIEFEAEVGYAGAPSSLDAPGGKTARRLRDAYHRAPIFRGWAEAPELVGMLSQLLEEEVCLVLAHHNCIMTKHPDYGTATGWHRDIRYWSFLRNELITVWLALGEETQENGGLQLIPASHRLMVQPEQLDKLDFLRPDLPQNKALFAQGVTPALKQGDVVLFHSGLFHAAHRNGTNEVKMSVAFAYRGKSNLPLPGTRSAAAGDVLLGTGSS